MSESESEDPRPLSAPKKKSALRATPRVHLVLDLLAAFTFGALAATGTLLQWRLPPGGAHGRAGAPTWLGLGRHDWGEVHFWIAAVAIAIAVVHVLLHWAWVRSVWPQVVRAGSGPVGMGTLSLLAMLLVLPFAIPVQGQNGAARASAEQRHQEARHPREQHAEPAHALHRHSIQSGARNPAHRGDGCGRCRQEQAGQDGDHCGR